jgi:O-antigen/teichoic acid export membrane protein
MIDQVVSSLINFSLGIFIARSGTPEEFAVYGLMFGTYLIAINISRPLGVEPLIIRFTGKPTTEWRAALGAATAIVLLVGLGLGAASIAVALLAGGFATIAFLILGIGLPTLVLQDAWRLSFFAEGRGRSAVVNDVGWATTFLVLVAGLAFLDAATPATIIAAWAIGAAVAAVIGQAQAGTRPRPSRRWWNEQRDIAMPLLGEHVATNVVNELQPWAIGAIAGLQAVAALRAAQLLLGPFNLVLQAFSLIALPEAVRVASRSRQRLRRLVIIFTIGLIVAVLFVGSVIAILPPWLGTAILGTTWPIAISVIVPYTIHMAAGMSSIATMIGLRALGEARETMVVAVFRSILTFSGAVIGATVGGAPVAIIGMALGNMAGGVAAWRSFAIALRR